MTKRSLLLLFFLVGCADGRADAPKVDAPKTAVKTKATRVEVAKIGGSRPKLELALPAEVEGARDSRVAARAGGYVEKLFVKRGDRVKAGHTIAWVDRAQQLVLVEQAKLNLEHAEAEAARAEKAGASLTQVRRDAASYQAKLARVQHQLAELGLSNATVRAPFDGVIAATMAEVGEVVPPGGPIARLVEMDPISVTISVSDQDIGNLTEGMAVSVAVDAIGQVLEGKIHHASPAADLDTRAFEVEVRVPNPNGALRPGMIATVRVEQSLDSDAVSIPQYVLVTRRAGNGVFVAEGEVARWRPVELGRLVGGQLLVRSGVAVGDEVIVTGHRELVDGDALIVTRRGECCATGRVVFGAADGP